jgi:hypothetical protein
MTTNETMSKRGHSGCPYAAIALPVHKCRIVRRCPGCAICSPWRMQDSPRSRRAAPATRTPAWAHCSGFLPILFHRLRIRRRCWARLSGGESPRVCVCEGGRAVSGDGGGGGGGGHDVVQRVELSWSSILQNNRCRRVGSCSGNCIGACS